MTASDAKQSLRLGAHVTGIDVTEKNIYVATLHAQWSALDIDYRLAAALGDEFQLLDRTGVRINPLDRSFHFTSYMGVNYMMLLERKAT